MNGSVGGFGSGFDRLDGGGPGGGLICDELSSNSVVVLSLNELLDTPLGGDNSDASTSDVNPLDELSSPFGVENFENRISSVFITSEFVNPDGDMRAPL
eukprot:TRINITY_DN4316_c0_g1_i1.p2 TRINITY_DN4316_c0_g1~~TRINITY_DN4316_c0_g1_i1.p2  ORF type:complete len:99 (-),score=13.79 TRINITY_DN4316_c0_g1_i1:209-505(-)